MQAGDLENKIRELVARGDLTDLGLTPSGNVWRATYAPASVHGLSVAEDADPIKALFLALTGTKLKSRKPVSKPSEETEVEPVRDEYLEGITSREEAYDPAA